ncbi:MAG: hypothetical protein QF886_18350, partial [Planctomycetota bacterium]|nr:hypothetical protein [Planctomycetota bacterium]
YLCAPFGRFSEPALPGELRLLQDVPALRVLCVWNAVVLPEESLAGSWHVGALDSDALGAVTAVRAYLDRGHQLPSGLEEDTGPPVIHPIDPRRDYRESEIEWSALLAGESDNPFLVRDAGDRGYGMGDDSQFLMAAEERARYGRELHYNIVGYALSLHITDKPEAASVRVDVLNVNGDPSRRLDGGYLLGIDGGRSVPIWLGRTWCDRSVLDRGFILFDDLGQPMPTAPAE